MSCGDHGKMNPILHGLYHVKEWDKKMAKKFQDKFGLTDYQICLLYTSPSPRDRQKSRMPSSA